MIRDIGKFLWRGWLKIADAIVYFQTRLILFVLYTAVLGLTAIFLRIFRVNVMGLKDELESFWQPKQHLNETEQGLLRQF